MIRKVYMRFLEALLWWQFWKAFVKDNDTALVIGPCGILLFQIISQLRHRCEVLSSLVQLVQTKEMISLYSDQSCTTMILVLAFFA